MVGFAIFPMSTCAFSYVRTYRYRFVLPVRQVERIVWPYRYVIRNLSFTSDDNIPKVRQEATAAAAPNRRCGRFPPFKLIFSTLLL